MFFWILLAEHFLFCKCFFLLTITVFFPLNFLCKNIILNMTCFFKDDWTSIFGSPTKLGLGLLSILFDVVFMIQHYVLYRVPIQANAYTPIA